jgi:hypothetical protein
MNIRRDRSVTTRMATPTRNFGFSAVGVLTCLAAVFFGSIAAAQNVCALLQASWFHKASSISHAYLRRDTLVAGICRKVARNASGNHCRNRALS